MKSKVMVVFALSRARQHRRCGCINLLFVVRVTVVVRSGHEENCKSKKE